MTSYLQRTKVYFFVIALFMCLSLFAFTSRYSTSGTIFRAIQRGPLNFIRNYQLQPNASDRSNVSKPVIWRPGGFHLVDQTEVSNIDEAAKKLEDALHMPTVSVNKQYVDGGGISAHRPNEIQGDAYFESADKSSLAGYDVSSAVIAYTNKSDKQESLHYISSKNTLTTQGSILNKSGSHTTENGGVIEPSIKQGLKLGNHLNKIDSSRRLKPGVNPNIRNILLNMRRTQGGVTIRPDECTNCFQAKFPTIIDPQNICPSNELIDLLIIITSSARNTDARMTVRQTWGSVCHQPESGIKCIFIFGNNNVESENKNLAMESDTYHDIYQADFIDTYANLTFKTITGFQWAMEHCQHVKYVMKTDDDVYLNTELLPVMLKAAPEREFMGGTCWGPSSPHRDTHSKWYVSYQQYMHPLFPQMCSGTGYILSRDVVDGVIRMSADIPFFYLEDVYVAVCAKKLGVQPVSISGFSNVPVDFEPCKFRNKVILCHQYTPKLLLDIWQRSRRCKRDNLTPEMLYNARRV